MNSVNRRDDNRFNCPIDGCVYAINGDKYFKRKLFLTQHIANKHSEKKFSCDKCMKKYAIEWQLKYHQKSCGLQWICGSCDKSYSERLSLVMHCKRHSHSLPKNALIKSSKSALISPPINVQLLVLPMIFDPNSSSTQSTNQSIIIQNQRLINILPKKDDMNSGHNCVTQTSVTEECSKCKIKSSPENIETNLKTSHSISTQTDRLRNKSCVSGEQRSTECQTIRKRNRKLQSNNNFESIETQTLESALYLTETAKRTNCLKISASTSTSPPKKTRKRCLIDHKLINDWNINVRKSSAFTQTVSESCTLTATTTDNSEVFVNNSNPLLSQIDSTNSILEQSVQTEAIEFCLDNEFNNIETQTVNLDISSDDLLDFATNEEFLFSEFTDIETQTIWNNDRTTQTDEYLDQINDVFLRYLDNETESNDLSNKTLCADTQTQTQIDFPLLTGSSSQTSQKFS